MSKTRIIATVVATAVAVGLTACASQPQPVPSTPAGIESPTPDPLETPVASPAPESILGGDCNALIPAADVSTLVGRPLLLRPVDTGMAYLAIRQVGGIHCVWSETEAVGGVAASIIVLPTRVAAEDRMFDECMAGWGCNFTRALGTANVFGVLHDPGSSPEHNEAVAVSLLSAIEPMIANVGAPAPWTVPAPWSIPIDCSTLSGGGSVGEILGEPGLVGNEYGGDAEPNSGWYASYFAAGVVRCTWDPTGRDISVSAEYLSGGGWAETTITALEGAETIAIEGVDSAVAVGSDYHLFDGGNWLILKVSDGAVADDQKSAIASALVAEMNERG